MKTRTQLLVITEMSTEETRRILETLNAFGRLLTAMAEHCMPSNITELLFECGEDIDSLDELHDSLNEALEASSIGFGFNAFVANQPM